MRKNRILTARPLFIDYSRTTNYSKRLRDAVLLFAQGGASQADILFAPVPNANAAEGGFVQLQCCVEASDFFALGRLARSWGMSTSELMTRILYAYDPHFRSCAENRHKA